MHPKLPDRILHRRHMRGVTFGRDGRLTAHKMPPCKVGHNTVEWVDGECFLCVRDRLWLEMAARET